MYFVAQTVLIFNPRHSLGGNKERQEQISFCEVALPDEVIIGSLANGKLLSSNEKREIEIDRARE